MRLFILFLSAALLFSACKNGTNASEPSASAKRYKLEGKVISVDRTAKKAKIEHEAVEGYMDAMTMKNARFGKPVRTSCVASC